jgi:hypothetical protein
MQGSQVYWFFGEAGIWPTLATILAYENVKGKTYQTFGILCGR